MYCKYEIHVIDQAGTTFQLKIKEALHILWETYSLAYYMYLFIFKFVSSVTFALKGAEVCAEIENCCFTCM